MRRSFVLLGAWAATTCAPAYAAPGNPRIGLIGLGTRQSNNHLLDPLRQGHDVLGWSDRSVTILDRWAEEDGKRLPGIVGELLGVGVDILVTAGTTATLAAARATMSLPIIFIGVREPPPRLVRCGLQYPFSRKSPVTRALYAPADIKYLDRCDRGFIRVGVV